MPDEILIEIYAQCGFRNQSLILLLDILEGLPEFKPTHWARDERPDSKSTYSRDDLLFAVGGLGDLNTPHLYGSAISYTAYFTIDRQHLNNLIISFGSDLNEESLAKILQLSSVLANALKAEYGYVHFLWKNAPERYMQEGSFALRYLQKYGPCPSLARTWFGSYLISLIGQGRLETCGASIQHLSYGGIQADLIENLVDADHRTLTIRQREVMEHLLPSGIFGDYSHPLLRKRGANWQPIPIDHFAD
ncbi:hypothetical protein [Leptolyngbya ohadii]|uniref:hypothetical protein n=1 Tax=Leptolyngbya ohadii TaxID=1962290 RepID=UPI000B59BE0B|nr:hypothetical protein [Leptolyngbya ohadii]